MELKEPWVISNGELIPKNLTIDYNGRKFTSPYPPIWGIRDDKLVYTTVPEISDKLFVKPCPPLWNNRNGKLVMGTVGEIKEMGAFNGCYLLTDISIPSTVTCMGPYALSGSGVTKIKINQNCTYYDSTFPENCEIEYY